MLAGLAVGCRALLAVILGLALVGKISSRAALRSFAQSLAVLPWLSRRRLPAALAIAAAEGTGAVLLALPGTASAGLALAAVLMAVFTAVPAVFLRQGTELTCRCFGVREATIGRSHVLRNGIALCAAVAGLAASQASSPGTRWNPVAIGLGVIAGIIFAGWDELAYLLRPPAQAQSPQSHLGGRYRD
jgi:hypothetical protein